MQQTTQPTFNTGIQQGIQGIQSTITKWIPPITVDKAILKGHGEAVFKKFDVNNDGKLNFQELKMAMEETLRQIGVLNTPSEPQLLDLLRDQGFTIDQTFSLKNFKSLLKYSFGFERKKKGLLGKIF